MWFSEGGSGNAHGESNASDLRIILNPDPFVGCVNFDMGVKERYFIYTHLPLSQYPGRLA